MHIFFDVDGTLSRSRQPLSSSMKELMLRLCEKHDVVAISGGSKETMHSQLSGVSVPILSMSGNYAESMYGELLWKNELSVLQKAEILSYVYAIIRQKMFNAKDDNDLIEDRNCQISYSLIGHHEVLQKKEVFDQDKRIRRALLKKHPFESEDVEVRIGGTTCLDFFIKGKHKGTNVLRYAALMNWEKKNVVYVGDGLFPGGNDVDVLGLVETHAVKSLEDTEAYIRQLLSK